MAETTKAEMRQQIGPVRDELLAKLGDGVTSMADFNGLVEEAYAQHNPVVVRTALGDSIAHGDLLVGQAGIGGVRVSADFQPGQPTGYKVSPV